MTDLRPFDSFIILAGMRTGSNLLQDRLDAVPGLRCHGEVFNPYFIAGDGRDSYLGMDLAARRADPLGMLQRLCDEGPEIAGFRFFPGHDLRVLEACLSERRCAKIILTRNPVEAYVSLLVAQATNQWVLFDPARRRSAQVRFDAHDFSQFLDRQQAFLAHAHARLQETGQTAFVLDYEDLARDAVLAGLVHHLTGHAPDRPLPAPRRRLMRQNPGPVTSRVENAPQMLASLGAIDWFDLARSSLQEFRPSTPEAGGLVLARGAPIVWLPMPGVAGQDRLHDWLSGLPPPAGCEGPAGQGLIKNPSPAQLHDWRISQGTKRLCLAVIEDPLTRVWRAFCRDVAPAHRRGDLAHEMARGYGMSLPQGKDLGADPSVRGPAFEAFLHLLGDLLSAQGPLPPDPAWRSQSTLLAARIDLGWPDHLIQAETIGPALGALAARMGLPPPQPAAIASPLADGLDAVATPGVVDLVARLYATDYAAFGYVPGFGPATIHGVQGGR